MFGVEERSELAVTHGGPKWEGGGPLFDLSYDFFEEEALMDEGFGLKAGAFACGDEEGEVDVGGDVLLADGVEDVRAGAMF